MALFATAHQRVFKNAEIECVFQEYVELFELSHVHSMLPVPLNLPVLLYRLTRFAFGATDSLRAGLLNFDSTRTPSRVSRVSGQLGSRMGMASMFDETGRSSLTPQVLLGVAAQAKGLATAMPLGAAIAPLITGRSHAEGSQRSRIPFNDEAAADGDGDGGDGGDGGDMGVGDDAGDDGGGGE
eukprot:CAMPEP_0181190390 /NCGR_PEP_ID=MMETSP1096-20121128/12168_1 /TAXON_ID=156174 ORGANISM="Chrysochromulina ericina, Strain CCMP281" /NCGR_SAMPLE_ID=MMETSP1096 /ASSEMBLY_ACC=CAM_ASM_000453 /LENGTH=182 /DNA_ID=CAMNT_0023279603 /DNA_START=32 /DNA_END=580 /DNA_ORIENTATION=-